MSTLPWLSTHTHEASRSMAPPPGRRSQPSPTAMVGCVMSSVSCRCRQSACRTAIEALTCSSPLALEQPPQLLTPCQRSLTCPPLRLASGMRTTPIGSLAPILSLSKMAKTSSVDSRRAAALASRLSLKVWFHTGLRLLSTTLVVPSVRLPHMMTTYGSELFFPKRLRSLATRSRPPITVQSISTPTTAASAAGAALACI
mmetsp:Transcript_70741/g.170846  ORF Transcript_70741/g.170846 Transcript_70741/m.170846 type:complete len:200 (+) Transcript_70741:761-1360(+)